MTNNSANQEKSMGYKIGEIWFIVHPNNINCDGFSNLMIESKNSISRTGINHEQNYYSSRE